MQRKTMNCSQIKDPFHKSGTEQPSNVETAICMRLKSEDVLIILMPPNIRQDRRGKHQTNSTPQTSDSSQKHCKEIHKYNTNKDKSAAQSHEIVMIVDDTNERAQKQRFPKDKGSRPIRTGILRKADMFDSAVNNIHATYLR